MRLCIRVSINFPFSFAFLLLNCLFACLFVFVHVQQVDRYSRTSTVSSPSVARSRLHHPDQQTLLLKELCKSVKKKKRKKNKTGLHLALPRRYPSTPYYSPLSVPPPSFCVSACSQPTEGAFGRSENRIVRLSVPLTTRPDLGPV